MDTHELLCAARNLIEKGWTRKKLRRKRPWGDKYCAMGALVYSDPSEWRARVEARLALSEVVGIDIIDFNDGKGRRKREVLAVFDAAIAMTAPEPHVELEEPSCVA